MGTRMRKCYPLWAKMYRFGRHELNNGCQQCFCQSARAIMGINTHLLVPHERKFQKTVLYIQKLLLGMKRVEWMKGICHIWSRGRLISHSMPVGDDWYLNLNSQKRPPGRNLGEHRLVRRSGATSSGTVVLVFCLRMRGFPWTDVPTILIGQNICVGSTENL